MSCLAFFVFESSLHTNLEQYFDKCCSRDTAVLICFSLWMSVFMKLVYDPFPHVTTVKVVKPILKDYLGSEMS